MITRLLRLLGIRRRRSSTKLTPRYEARRVARLSKCNRLFAEGKVGAMFEGTQRG